MEQRQVTRKGSGVGSATIVKAAPQVIVGCGYLTDVIISLSVEMGTLGTQLRGVIAVRLCEEGRVAPESSVLDVPRISRVSLYKVCKSRRYKLKLVEVWIASSPPHQYPSREVQWAKICHRVRFDSGKRAVETKLLKLVLFIADGIGTINL